MDIQISKRVTIIDRGQGVVLIQGEHRQTTINFILPSEVDGIDLSALTWEVRCVNTDSDTFMANQLTAAGNGDTFSLAWLVEREFTGTPTEKRGLQTTLVGLDGDSIVAKYAIDGLRVRREEDAEIPGTGSYIEIILTQISSAATRAETAASAAEAAAAQLAQTGINFKILGYYVTLTDLEAAITSPAIGDAYLVGSNPSTVYIWTGSQWTGGQQISIDVAMFLAKSTYDPAGGAKQVAFADEVMDKATYILPGAGPHNSIYRGKGLGTAVTDEQYAAINGGTFEDLYIGDYWTIGGVNYRIAAFDYFYNVGDTALLDHHAVIVPDKILYSATMNATNITTGGYTGSVMRATNLATAKTTIKAAFNGHVVNHRQLLTNAVNTSGQASGWAWFDCEVELMNEVMVYGSVAFGASSVGASGYNVATSHGVLPLFAIRHDLVNTRESYWLRDVASATHFAYVSNYGNANGNNASGSFGVRPAFSIS